MQKNLKFLGELSYLQVQQFFWFLIHVYNSTFILSVTEPGGRRGVKLSTLARTELLCMKNAGTLLQITGGLQSDYS